MPLDVARVHVRAERGDGAALVCGQRIVGFAHDGIDFADDAGDVGLDDLCAIVEIGLEAIVMRPGCGWR